MNRAYKMALFLLIITCLNCLVFGQQVAYLDNAGTIKGIVVDSRGQPAYDMIVYAENKETHTGILPHTRTDRGGRFLIEGVLHGTYKVYAGNEDRGYPESPYGFYQSQHPPVLVKVEVNKITDKVVVKLDDKPGRIKLSIRDKLTNQSVTNAKIILQSVKDPNYRWERESADIVESSIFATAEPFVIEVRAPGYKVWKLTVNSGKGQGEIFNVPAGRTKSVLAVLERE